MARISQNRRTFLRTLALLGGGWWFLGRYLRQGGTKEQRLARVADADIPPRGALVYRNERFAIVREAGSVYALSLVCTHLGCTVNVAADVLRCPCHGSVFDRRGNVRRGPATRALTRLRLQRDGDYWLVFSRCGDHHV